MLTLTVKELGENAMKTKNVATSTDPLVNYLKSRTHENYTNLQRSTCQQIFSTAYRVLHDRAAAEDVTQEVFIKILVNKTLKAKEITSGVGYLCSLATSIARTSLRGELRRTQRQQSSQETFALYNGEEVSQDDLLDIRDAVVDLPEPVRVCVELRYFSGLTIREIGKTLNLTAGAIHGRLEKGLGILKARLSVPALAFVTSVISGSAEATVATITVSSLLSASLEHLDEASQQAKAVSLGAASTGFLASKLVKLPLMFLAIGGIAGLLSWSIWPDYMNHGIASLLGNGYGQGIVDGEVKNPGFSVVTGNTAGEGSISTESQTVSVPVPTNSSTLSVRIEDNRGNLIQNGVVGFKIPRDKLHLRDNFGGIEGIPDAIRNMDPPDTAISPLYRIYDLSEANPIVVNDIPNEYLPLEIEVLAFSTDIGIPENQYITLKPSSTVASTLTLTPGDTAKFEVVDSETGLPIQGALIYPTRYSERVEDHLGKFPGADSFKFSMGVIGVSNFKANPKGAVRSDEKGFAKIAGIEEFTQPLEVTAKGYQRLILPDWSFDKSQTVELVKDSGGETGELTVEVLDALRKPMVGLKVVVGNFGEQLNTQGLSGKTDENGKVFFDDLQPGEAMITFPSPSRGEKSVLYIEQVKSLPLKVAKIKAGENTHSLYVAKRGEATLSVEVDRSVVPWDCNVQVTVKSKKHKRSILLIEESVAEFFHLFDGTYEVRAELRCGENGSQFINEPETVELVNGENKSLSIKVKGHIAVGGQVEKLNKKSDVVDQSVVLFKGPVNGSAFMKRDGSYQIQGLVPGTYRIEIFSEDFWIDNPVVEIPQGVSSFRHNIFFREARKVSFSGETPEGEFEHRYSLTHIAGPGFDIRKELQIPSIQKLDSEIVWLKGDKLPVGQHTFLVESQGRHSVELTVSVPSLEEDKGGSVHIDVPLGDLDGSPLPQDEVKKYNSSKFDATKAEVKLRVGTIDLSGTGDK